MMSEIYFKLSFAKPHKRINCDFTFLNSSQMLLIDCVVFEVFSITSKNNFVSSDSSSSTIDRTDVSQFLQNINSEWMVSRSSNCIFVLFKNEMYIYKKFYGNCIAS